MPKRINVKESKPFYYAYKVGKDGNNICYGEIIKAEGHFTSYNGSLNVNYYGEEISYNATLVLQDKIKYIDNFTKIWYGITPLNNEESPTHTVVRKGEVYNGLYTIYLQSNISNKNNLWVEYKDKIIEIDIDFDYDELVGKVSKDTYCPIDYLVNVWITKPQDITSIENKIELTYKKETDEGVILYFKKVE